MTVLKEMLYKTARQANDKVSNHGNRRMPYLIKISNYRIQMNSLHDVIVIKKEHQIFALMLIEISCTLPI
jgi:hypothetical protein